MSWTIEDLRRLDAKYAKEGVHMHQRPFRAAVELLGPAFIIGVGGNPEVDKITQAYRAMLPEARDSWPGMGIGLAVSVDQVRKMVLPVIFGSHAGLLDVASPLDFKNQEDWWRWCREDRDIAAESHFAYADLFDFAYGVDDLRSQKPEAQTLWRMAGSNLSDAANALPASFSVDSLIQSICMVAELSLKAALVFNGADPNEFRGPKGHGLVALAKRLSAELPHRDDPLVQAAITELPPYVQSRYAPAGLTRFRVVRLALAVQFVAASTVRRLSQRDLASQMEVGGWPAPRRPFFA
ncbi:MAG: HEPN domain-containing protein [Mesorhizobium sp.]|nr:MAG: HEPN domain-containing protein [Mesorhizobium sp.]